MNSRPMTVFVLMVVLVFGGVGAGWARPAPDDTDALAAVDTQILSEIRDHSQAMENLEYLSDEIGPRLSGSPQLKEANNWTAVKFREYGLTNLKLEPWTIAHSWTRETAYARVVSPAEHPLTIASAGWSPGTAGVPGFLCVQDGSDYDKTHHSQVDTLDRVRWEDLTEGAQVLAVFAYNVAQLPEMLPRKAAKPGSD